MITIPYLPLGRNDWNGYLVKVAERFKYKLNTQDIIVGGTGHGKSTWSFRLAMAVSKTFGLKFDPDKNIHFYADELVDDFDQSEETCIVLDDAGYQYDRQKWQSKTAWAVKIIQETTRIKMNFFILNLPFLILLPDESVALSQHVWNVKFQGKAFFNSIQPNYVGTKHTYWRDDLKWFFAFKHLDGDPGFERYILKKKEFLHINSGELKKGIEMERMTREISYLRKKNTLEKLKNPPKKIDEMITIDESVKNIRQSESI